MFRAILATLSQVIAWPFIGFARLYQLMISPWLAPRCRFYPTCSEYALETFKKRFILIALWLVAKRLLKCHPFHPGGVDLPKTGSCCNKEHQ